MGQIKAQRCQFAFRFLRVLLANGGMQIDKSKLQILHILVVDQDAPNGRCLLPGCITGLKGGFCSSPVFLTQHALQRR